MAEKVQLAAKTSKAKENSASTTQKIESPQSMSSPIDQVMYLQRTIGNQAVQRLIKSGTLQTKLKIGQPGDRYEQEADRVADAVMRMPEPRVQRQPIEEEEEEQIQTRPVTELITPLVQRRVEEEEEEQVQAKPVSEQIIPLVQRQVEEEEDEKLQKKEASGSTPEVTPEFESHINATRGGGQLLSESMRAFYEPRFGTDFSQVRVHTNTRAAESAKSINVRAFTIGKNIAFGASQYAPESHEGRHLLAHELTHVMQQGKGFRAVQMKDGKKRRKRKVIYVSRSFEVTRELSTTEFRTMVMKHLFGGVIPNVIWSNSKPKYTPDKSPYTVQVDIELIRKFRGQVNIGRGLDVDIKGGIKGAKGRARRFHAGAETKEKSALMDEIDRRYYVAAGVAPGTKIKKGEKGRAALWRMIRDEVLLQHEYITNLPPQVKKLIKFSIKGRELTPADYDKLFAIAKKIEKMPAGQVSDYASKVTGATTDLDKFEASLDRYIAEMAERGKQGEEREKIQTKLIGLEEVYKKYRDYRKTLNFEALSAFAMSGAGTLPSPVNLGPTASSQMRKELESQLQAHGFAGISEFEAYIKKFEQAFEQEAANIAKDFLEKYAGKLYRESERYKKPAEVAALHRKLGGVRTLYREFETNAKIWNDYVKARNKAKEQSRIPGQAHLRTSHFTSITPSEAQAARKKSEAAKAASKSQVKGMSGEHPIFQEEEGLPSDKRIDKVALAMVSETQLGWLLQGHIQNRMKDIGEARAEIHKKPELIYKMKKLMPHFYVQQGIRPDSIFDMIIRDKIESDAIKNLVIGISVAIVSIALTVVSLGSATPALLAAGAAAGAFGISAYMAYEEIQQYATEKQLADVGLVKDPSMVWLVIAVLGAVVDMTAAAKALKGLDLAADVLKAGDIKDISKALKALQKAAKIDAKIAQAVEKAAKARAAFKEATAELTKALTSRIYTFPPFTDPDVYKALVRMAKAKIQQGTSSITEWYYHVKRARAVAKLGELTPEELNKLKEAWGEAQKLIKDEAASVAKYGDSMSKLLARADLPDDLRNDIIAQVARAMNNSSVDDNAVRVSISSMRRAENPHNVREFLAELRHVNEVASSKSLAKGSKVYSGVKKSLRDGSLRQFDLGDGIKVDISPVSQADALYRAGGKIHLDEVKRTASALVNKLRKKPQQLQNLVGWRGKGPDRAVSVVIESEVKWTNLLGTPDVFELLITNKIPLKIGGKVFDPAALKAFHAKIKVKYLEHIRGGMSPRAFFELPEMATLDSVAKFVGYP